MSNLLQCIMFILQYMYLHMYNYYTGKLYMLHLPVRIRGRMNMQFFVERPIGERLNAHSDIFVCFWREPLSTRHAWCAIVALDLYIVHVYTQSFLRVHGAMVRWLWTKGTASNEWVYSFVDPFIQDLFLWRTSQEFVKTDLYPLSLISLWYAVCLTGWWSIIGCCVRACQWSNCAEERWP